MPRSRILLPSLERARQVALGRSHRHLPKSKFEQHAQPQRRYQQDDKDKFRFTHSKHESVNARQEQSLKIFWPLMTEPRVDNEKANSRRDAILGFSGRSRQRGPSRRP